MREFKFRVWCPRVQAFSKHPLLHCDGLQLTWLHCGNQSTISDVRFDGYVIQQFTGVLDKKDREIYEGDILKWGELNYEVLWAENKWIATCPNYCKHHWPRLDYFSLARACEVVGNVFEDLHLLK